MATEPPSYPVAVEVEGGQNEGVRGEGGGQGPEQDQGPQSTVSTAPAIQRGPVIVDLILFAGMVAAVVGVMMVLPPPMFGFYCVPEISYEYIEPARRYSTTFVAVMIIIPTVLVPILMVESIAAYIETEPGRPKYVTFLINFYRYTGSCVVGFLINVVMCGMAKYLVGLNAPNFLHLCRPEVAPDLWWACKHKRSFISTYTCQGNEFVSPDSMDVFFSQMSFYSIHASCAMHAAVYSSVYLHSRMTYNVYGRALRPMALTLFVVGALFNGYVRVVENMSHVIDVAAGFIFGIVTALFTAFCVARMLERTPAKGGGDEMAAEVVPETRPNDESPRRAQNSRNEELPIELPPSLSKTDATQNFSPTEKQEMREDATLSPGEVDQYATEPPSGFHTIRDDPGVSSSQWGSETRAEANVPTIIATQRD